MAPSIYEYSSAAEWEQAMAEWCAENEPRIFAVYVDYSRYAFGEEKRVLCDTQQEALEIIRQHFDPKNDCDIPYIRIEIGTPTEQVVFIRPFGNRATDGKYDRWSGERDHDKAILRLR